MQASKTTKKIPARKLTVLLLLAAPDSSGTDKTPISGTTRMQKLVFLAMKKAEPVLKNDEEFRFDFSFSPDRFGPADLELYEDLELLRVTGWISIDGESGFGNSTISIYDNKQGALTLDSLLGEAGSGRRIPAEDSEESELSFDYLMGEDSEEEGYAEVEEEQERVYAITDRGIDRLKLIQSANNKPEKFDHLAAICSEVKRQFGVLPLSALLRYVYKTYPETTTKSEIRSRVLGS